MVEYRVLKYSQKEVLDSTVPQHSGDTRDHSNASYAV